MTSTTDDDWERLISVNLTAPRLWARAVVPHLLEGGGGSIVIVTSINGSYARPNSLGYTASKTGALGLVRSLAVDYGREGVRTNSISPGSVETPMLLAAMERAPHIRTEQLERTYSPRIGLPEDIAAGCAFLLSDDAAFVNGADLADRRWKDGGDLMPRYDGIVVGAGAAGLVCASLLAKSGKRVAVVEKHRYLGGRAMEQRFRGHQIGLGSHLVEDPGDSLQRVCDWVGSPFSYSERSDSMPFWDTDRWRPIQEYYGGGAKQGLKACIEALTETPYEELDRWDHASLREWMGQYTSEEGVFQVWEAISVLEQITFKPFEHSASENLYTRKLHYELKRTAGYSFWPMGGWEKLWKRTRRSVRGARRDDHHVGQGLARGRPRRRGARRRAGQRRRAARGRRGRRQRAGVGHPEAVRRRRAAMGLPRSA